ncbi:hypothetical protein BDV59DRAFT_177517 [Aspergillus ambiguus]|uniref:uncharacterized protein n=1 Tax=Aspergillus ambiguus TaxID=176160 RepID=UPI003CCCE308
MSGLFSRDLDLDLVTNDNGLLFDLVGLGDMPEKPDDAADYHNRRQHRSPPRKRQRTANHSLPTVQHPDLIDLTSPFGSLGSTPTASPAYMAPSTPFPFQDPSTSPTSTADVVLAQIIELFPDISPDYVTQLVRPLHGSDDPSALISGVVHQILDKPSYPKRAKRKLEPNTLEGSIEENHKKYLVGPDVQTADYKRRIIQSLEHEFPYVPLLIIKDAVNREKCLYSAYLKLFKLEHLDNPSDLPYVRLKHRRPRSSHKETDLLVTYNLSGNDKELEAAKRDANALREEADQKAAEKLNEEQHIRLGRLVECQCCYSDVPSNRHITCLGPNAHPFCYTCVRKSAETQVGLMKHQVHCMDTSGCTAKFTRSRLHTALGSALLDKLDALQQDDEIQQANLEGLESCPFCDFKAICAPVEEDREFRCLKPSCEMVSCRLCKAESHLPQTCAEARRERGVSERHQVEEAMSEALIRPCPRCKVKIVKESGCNRMFCTRCHCFMCYVCRKDITHQGSYNHFNRAPTFCPTWDHPEKPPRSHSEVDNAQDAAIARLLQSNPTLTEEDLRVHSATPKKQKENPAPTTRPPGEARHVPRQHRPVNPPPAPAPPRLPRIHEGFPREYMPPVFHQHNAYPVVKIHQPQPPPLVHPFPGRPPYPDNAMPRLNAAAAAPAPADVVAARNARAPLIQPVFPPVNAQDMPPRPARPSNPAPIAPKRPKTINADPLGWPRWDGPELAEPAMPVPGVPFTGPHLHMYRRPGSQPPTPPFPHLPFS